MELQIIQNKIYDIRGIRVMLDYDLAKLYDVETRALKQAVKRNIDRFPAPDFMFELTREESDEAIKLGVSQNVIPRIQCRLFLNNGISGARHSHAFFRIEKSKSNSDKYIYNAGFRCLAPIRTRLCRTKP